MATRGMDYQAKQTFRDYGATDFPPIHKMDDYAKIIGLISESVREITKKEAFSTRQHIDKIKEEIIEKVKEGNLTIVDCIRYNSTKNIRIMSLSSVAIAASSLLISGVAKFHIINPLIAILLLIGSFGFYIMTKFDVNTGK